MASFLQHCNPTCGISKSSLFYDTSHLSHAFPGDTYWSMWPMNIGTMGFDASVGATWSSWQLALPHSSGGSMHRTNPPLRAQDTPSCAFWGRQVREGLSSFRLRIPTPGHQACKLPFPTSVVNTNGTSLSNIGRRPHYHFPGSLILIFSVSNVVHNAVCVHGFPDFSSSDRTC